MNNSFSLIKIIGGLSKTLGIVNEFIPIYKKIKPTISKSISFISNVSDNIKKMDNKSDNVKEQISISANSPTFFL